MSTSSSPRPWTTLQSRITHSDEWLTVRSDSCETDSGVRIEPYHVLHYPDWIHVVAVTPALEIVLVEQYRHAIGEVVIELPAGSVDASDDGPLVAAQRELLEETGYDSDDFRLLGVQWANPATHTNRAFSYLALNARRVAEQKQDPREEIGVRVVDARAWLGDVLTGNALLQSYHLAALAFLQSAILRAGEDDPLHALRPLLAANASSEQSSR